MVKYNNIIIFGAGYYGEYIARVADILGIRVQFFTDNDKNKHEKTLLGVPINTPSMLGNFADIPVFIANKSPNAVNEIEAQLRSLGNFTVLKNEKELLQFYKPNYFTGTQLPIAFDTYLEITTVIGCKVACKLCPQNILIKKYREKNQDAKRKMSFEVFKACIENVPQKVEIRFCGMSEPFLNDECSKMMVYAHEKGHKIGLLTTLVGANEHDVELISHIHFVYIDIHLPDINMNAKISVTEQYKNVLKLFISKVHADIILYNSHGQIPEEIDEIIQEHNFICKKIDPFDRAGNLKSAEVPSVPFVKGQIYCTHSYRMLNRSILLPDGSIVLCCMDYALKHVLGNLLENTYEDILQNENAQKIRMAFDDDRQKLLCRTCYRAKKISDFGGSI